MTAENSNLDETVGNEPAETGMASQSVIEKKFTSNYDGLVEIMGLNKQQVLDILGDNFTKVDAYEEDVYEDDGYYYDEFGITIVFDDELAVIDRIECNEKVDVYGAKIYMTISEIEGILGEGEFIDLNSENPPFYALFYDLEYFTVWFGFEEEKGKSTDFQIRRIY